MKLGGARRVVRVVVTVTVVAMVVVGGAAVHAAPLVAGSAEYPQGVVHVALPLAPVLAEALWKKKIAMKEIHECGTKDKY